MFIPKTRNKSNLIIKNWRDKSLSETCPSMLKRLGILFSLALSLLVTLKGKLHLMIDRCRRSVKKGTLDFGNNIFHGTVDSVRAWVCPKRCYGNRPNTKIG